MDCAFTLQPLRFDFVTGRNRILWGFLIVAMVLLGTALRVRVGADLPFDADEAIAGLMARNIAFEGERPLFWYGEAYVGVATQYLVGGLFRVFGFQPNAIRWPQYVLAALFLWLGYIIAVRSGSREAGLWTLLLLAFPPVFLSFMNLKSWGDYNETYCLGGLLWWLSLVLTQDSGGLGWKKFAGYFAWGAFFGLGLWIHFPIVIYAIPTGLFLLVAGRRTLAGYSLLGVGFLLGWFPALLYNFTHRFANLGYAGKGAWDYLTRIEESARQLTRLVVEGIPFLLGVRSTGARFIDFQQFDPLFAQVPILGGFLGLVVLYLYRHDTGWRASLGLRDEDPEAARVDKRAALESLIPILMLLLVATAVVYGRWGGRSFTPRYYSFAYLPLFVIAGRGLSMVSKRFLSGVVLWIGLFLYSNLYGHTAFLNHPPARTSEKLVAFLEEKEIPAVFTDYWNAHPVTYLTNERIVGSVHGGPVRHERYRRYSRMAEEAPDAAYALYTVYSEDLVGIFRKEMERLGVSYREEPIEDLTVFHDLSRKVNPDEMELYYRY